MTKKRAANRELNHDNWDKEDSDEEERGSIAVASDAILQKRTILKAKRRKPTDSPEPEAEKPVNIFQGFSFTSNANSSNSNTTTAPPLLTFSFFPTSSSSATATTGATKSASETSKTTPSSSFSGLSNVVNFATDADTDAKSESSYQKEIERLNKGFLDWITHHINKNPCCILSPVFKDYNRYVSELDMECVYPSSQESADEDKEASSKSESKKTKLTSSPTKKTVGFDVPAATSDAGSSKSSSSLSTSTAASTKMFSFGAYSPPTTVTSSSSSSSTNFFGFGSSSSAGSNFKWGNNSSTQSSLFSNFKSNDDDKKVNNDSKAEQEGTNKTNDNVNQSVSSFNSNKEKSTNLFSNKSETAITNPFGFLTDANKPATLNPFTFTPSQEQQQPANKTDSLPTNPTFGFSSNIPFSFGSSSSTTFGKGFFSKPAGENTETSAGNEDEKEEEYVPPKPESVETKEEGSFYTTRCKLYYKKEEKYDERGVGFLHLKPNGNKTQMIVRTDTALGNILLNINVGKLMPISRQGVNNVNIICIPNPPLDEKKPSNTPIPVLIRVKTKDNADELFKQLTEAQAKL